MFRPFAAIFGEIFNKEKYSSGLRPTHTASKYEYGPINDITKPENKGITLKCIEDLFISLY
jgi:hypothetical protein